jgi:hypothetical protein
MKKIGIVLVAIGFVLTLLSLFGDVVGLGRRGAVGAAQLFAIQIGVGIILSGVLVRSIKLNGPIQIRGVLQETLTRTISLPPAFWIYQAFFVSYLVFFFFPVFLNSKLDILYLNDFISDQGRMGFDIRSIVQRIENWLVQGQSPYADGFIGYPPLVIFLFSPFILADYPAYFRLITVLTILCYVASTLVIPLLIINRKDIHLLLLIFFTGLFSYGIQFELERGQFNVIAFTFCLLAIYLFHEREEFRYWAYLLFTLSIQLKVYPVFFIVMFIRDWRNNIRRLLGLAVINLSLLFILGYQMFRDFLRVIFAYQFDYDSNRYENLSIKGFVHSLAGGDIVLIPESLRTLVQQNIPLFEALFYTLLGVCFLSILARAYFDNGRRINPHLLLVCTICSLVIPSVSNDYKLSILAAPMAIMLASLPAEINWNVRAWFIPIILIASFAYWSVLYPFSVKPELLYRNFPALMVLLISLVPLNSFSRVHAAKSSVPAGF